MRERPRDLGEFSARHGLLNINITSPLFQWIFRNAQSLAGRTIDDATMRAIARPDAVQYLIRRRAACVRDQVCPVALARKKP